MIDGAIDEDMYRRLGEELLETWNAGQGSDFTPGRKGRPWTTRQLAVVHSLSSHVHRLYVPVTRLLDERWAVEAMPLIRTAFQTALTAQWIAQTSDGAEAFFNEDVRQRQQLERTAELAIPASIRGDTSIYGIDLTALETSATGPARNFNQLCDDLVPGGASAYFSYRVLSTQCHPSAAMVDRYLEADDSGDITAIRLDPNEPDTGAWRGLAVSTLVWAGRAVDFFDATNRRRSQLRDAAREIGIESALQLSPAAQAREARR